MTIIIRPMRTPGDYEGVSKLFMQFRSIPVTAEQLADEDTKIPAHGSLWKNEEGMLCGHDRLRLVAVDTDGLPIGCGFLWRAPWTEPGDLNLTLIVDAAHRGKGIGRALRERLEAWGYEQGAARLNTEVRDSDERSQTFAAQSGFVLERHLFESVLDPKSVKLERFNDRLREVERNGIVIRPMSELEEPDKLERVYAVYKESVLDIPGYRGDCLDFNEWRKWTIEIDGANCELLLVATRGGEYAGTAQLLDNGADGMYHEYTGVRKEYRGQGIALALKIACIALAAARNTACLRTNNDSMNGPMFHINRDVLGYQAVPGYHVMMKRLNANRG